MCLKTHTHTRQIKSFGRSPFSKPKFFFFHNLRFQIDNKGQRLPLADSDTMKSINTPAVGAAYGIRK